MTHTAPPPIPTLIPDSAPFTPEQRVWLNGFFAGLLSLDGGISPLPAAEAAALLAGISGAPAARGPQDEREED
jgi:sulfite reductase (NADPH) flavoprotein alpha-component